MIYSDTFESLASKVGKVAQGALLAQGFKSWISTDDPEVAATDLAALRRMQQDGILYTWSGCCENTIWGSSWNNMLARVWHDCVHLELGADFNYHDECRVASHQAHSTLGLTPLERGAVWADTFGMINYLERYGKFPDQQADFVRDYMASGYRM